MYIKGIEIRKYSIEKSKTGLLAVSRRSHDSRCKQEQYCNPAAISYQPAK